MRTLYAFVKKEWLEQHRSGRLYITLSLFVLLGIMNPAVAKLTPWLLEVLSDSLLESGMIVTEVQVSALDSWVQFYKNLPIGLVAFVLLHASSLTREYEAGTLVLSLTKGLDRYKVVLSKSSVLLSVWSLGYWLSFGITYLYNAYFWDNAVAESLLLSVFCWWLFGVFAVALMTLFSTLSASSTGVLLGTGGVVLASYAAAFLPKLKQYLPTILTDGNSLIFGERGAEDCTAAIVITTAVTVACLVAAIPIFNKRRI